MEALRNPVILISLLIYMLLCIGIGIWALRRTKSTSDFFIAGRNLGVMVTAFAVFSCTMSGFGFVGGPGLVYKMGMSSVWMVIASLIGFNISFFLLGKRLRLFSELGGSISLPDAVALRYGNKTTGFFIAIAIIMGVMGYLATQILAMSIVLRDILLQTGIVESIMIIGAVLIFATVITLYDGGLASISQTIFVDDKEAIGPWGTLGMIGCLSWLFVFGLGASGQPHVITKMMMNKKVSDARHILPVSIFGYFFFALLWISIGLVMRALVLKGMHPELTSADTEA